MVSRNRYNLVLQGMGGGGGIRTFGKGVGKKGRACGRAKVEGGLIFSEGAGDYSVMCQSLFADELTGKGKFFFMHYVFCFKFYK